PRGMVSGWIAARATAAATNGEAWATVVRVHSRSARRRLDSLTRFRQGTAASSGSVQPEGSWRSAVAAVSASGDWSPQDHQLGVDRQLAHLLGRARDVRDGGEAPLIELAAEDRYSGLDAGRVIGRPP